MTITPQLVAGGEVALVYVGVCGANKMLFVFFCPVAVGGGFGSVFPKLIEGKRLCFYPSGGKRALAVGEPRSC